MSCSVLTAAAWHSTTARRTASNTAFRVKHIRGAKNEYTFWGQKEWGCTATFGQLPALYETSSTECFDLEEEQRPNTNKSEQNTCTWREYRLHDEMTATPAMKTLGYAHASMPLSNVTMRRTCFFSHHSFHGRW